MPSSYTPSLTLTQIGNGEQSGTWGTTTNNNWQLIEDAVAGNATITLSGVAGYTLSVANGTTDESRKAVIVAVGSTSGTNAIIAPLEPKVYVISNQTTGGFPVTIGASTGSVVTIPNGVTTLVYCDGTNFYSGITGFTGGNLTITGNITASGTVTAPVLNGSLSLPGSGPTGGSGSAGQIPYQIAGNATNWTPIPTTANTFLEWTGSGFAWTGATGTASNITGGATNQLVYQSNTNSTSFIGAPSGPNQVLTYNGSQILWESGGAVSTVSASSPLASSGGTSPNISLSGVVPIANGGTGATSFAAAGLATTSSLSSYAQLSGSNSWNGTNNYAAGSLISMASTGSGTQAIQVSYGGYNSGLAPDSCQLGLSGYGALFTTSGFDGQNAIGFLTGAGAQIEISNSGNMYTSAGTAYKQGSSTAWTIYSDARIKTNVTPYTKGLAELNQVKIVNFEFNGLAKSTAGMAGLGVIADDIATVLPNTVTTLPAKLNPTDESTVDLKTFDSTELFYLLVTSVQQLSAQVTAQAAQITALQAKVGS
jgi:hypothetical protein